MKDGPSCSSTVAVEIPRDLNTGMSYQSENILMTTQTSRQLSNFASHACIEGIKTTGNKILPIDYETIPLLMHNEIEGKISQKRLS